jgi:predicted RNA-binding protein Jag
MSPRERRVVHLALKDMPGVRTESIGMGDERQVVIHPADSKPSN